jgi:hypothetical protein
MLGLLVRVVPIVGPRTIVTRRGEGAWIPDPASYPAVSVKAPEEAYGASSRVRFCIFDEGESLRKPDIEWRGESGDGGAGRTSLLM